jgi:hypothetical protein
MMMTAWPIFSLRSKTAWGTSYHKLSLLFRLFRRHFCTAFVFCLWFAAFAAPLHAQQGAQEKQLFDRLNDARRQAGLEPLEWDEDLAHAARLHSQLMAKKNQLGHVLPGEEEVSARLVATGIHFNRSGENVAYNSDFDDFTQAWLDSPPHKENMLSPNYNVVGIGVAKSDDGLFYATQDFAHSLAHLSEAQARQLTADAFNSLRTKDGHAPLQVIGGEGVQDLACSMALKGKLDPKRALKLPNVLEAVVFNNSRPEDLPESARKAAERDRYSKFAVGACFTTGQPQNPGGTFFVVMTFYE